VSGQGFNKPPRIFVASLSEYGAGRIRGGWVEVCDGVPSVSKQLRSRLSASDTVDHEWIVLDYDGFGSFRVPDYIDVPTLVAIGEGISEHGLAFAAFLTISNGEAVAATRGFEDSYVGHWEDPCDYAEEWAVNSGFTEDLLPEHLREYVHLDLDALVDDLEQDVAFVPAPDGGVYVFACRAEV
jgi:antirestriction protein